MSVKQDAILPPEEAPDASSKLFREYAAEFLELSRNARSALPISQDGESLAGDNHSLGKRFAQASEMNQK
jgi:hypothetical protein